MFAKIFAQADKEPTHQQTPALTRNGIRLGGRIGSGGFGAVYRCTWRNTTTGENEDSAVKIIETSKLSQDYIATHLQDELDAIRNFEHGHIVKSKFIYHLDSRYYIVMELMGCSLDDLLDKVGSLPEARVKFYYKQLLSALEYIHIEKKYAHRDIKCENILLSGDEQHNVLKVADFGLTRRCIDHRTGFREMSKTFCGTEDYRAPELLDPTTPHYDPQVSDIWSAGCVLYRMLYGHLPFSEPSMFRQLLLADFVKRQRTMSVFTKKNSSPTLRAFVNAHFHSNAAMRSKVDEILLLEWIQ